MRTKRVLSILLTLCLICSLSPLALAAGKTYTINGKTVSTSSGTAVGNCSAYAGQVLKKIWTVNQTMTIFNCPYNLLKGKSANDRKITEAHVREYIQATPLGSRIRVCTSSDEFTNNYDNSSKGHTMVLVDKNNSAGTFTVLEAGWGAAADNTYTYKSFADYFYNQKNYYYFFYITDYSAAATNRIDNSNNSSSNSSNTQPTTKPSATYSDCNVQVTCVNGQTVNLYNNPGDTSRVTYFNKGQVAYSTYLAKMSDGTTWYRVGAVYNGTDRMFWLKYESSKMKVTDRNDSSYTVTFNANGGSVSTSSKSVTNGSTYGTLPTPTWSNHTFDGWYTAQSGGSKVTDSTKVNLTGNQTLYAHWTSKNTYTITFDPTGGSVSPTTKTYSEGSLIGTLPTPTRSGYTFKYWSTAYMRSGMIVSADNYTVTENATLYAVWDENKVTNNEPTTKEYTVTFDPIGYGLLTYSKTVTNGSTYGTLPTPPTVKGATFDGWYTAKSGGTKITESTKVNLTGDQKLYAHWTVIPNTSEPTNGTSSSDNTNGTVENDTSTTEPTWTEWSEWSTTWVSSSPTRRVQSREVQLTPAHTEYRYGRYVDSTGTHDCWCAKYLEGLSYISGKASLQYSEWTTKLYGTSGKSWTCGNCNGTHIGVDHKTSDGRSWWPEYILPSGSYYWYETRQVGATYGMEYRYSDLV